MSNSEIMITIFVFPILLCVGAYFYYNYKARHLIKARKRAKERSKKIVGIAGPKTQYEVDNALMWHVCIFNGIWIAVSNSFVMQKKAKGEEITVVETYVNGKKKKTNPKRVL